MIRFCPDRWHQYLILALGKCTWCRSAIHWAIFSRHRSFKYVARRNEKRSHCLGELYLSGLVWLSLSRPAQVSSPLRTCSLWECWWLKFKSLPEQRNMNIHNIWSKAYDFGHLLERIFPIVPWYRSIKCISSGGLDGTWRQQVRKVWR